MTKNFCKILALICAFTAFLFSLGGCDMFIDRDADYTLVEVDEDFDVDTIYANCANNRFVIAPSQDGNFKLTYYKADYYPLNHEVKEGTLSLTGKYSKIVVGHVSSKVRTVTLFVPESFWGNIDITTSNGDISIKELKFDDVKISTSNGGVSLIDSTFIGADVKTSNGEIQLQNITAEGAIKLKSSNGALDLKNVSAAGIEGKTSNGAVNLSEIDCGDIDFTTSNGRIEADISGDAKDYTIFVSTSNGDIYLEGVKIKNGTVGGGVKNLSLNTSNGSIKINFSQK